MKCGCHADLSDLQLLACVRLKSSPLPILDYVIVRYRNHESILM